MMPFHVTRLNSLLVALPQNIDYIKTFSPIVYLNFVCVDLSFAINQAGSLHQLDVSSTFFHGDLKEHVFLEQTLKCIAYEESSKVCFLQRDIHGLKKSPCGWFAKLIGLLSAFSFTSSVADSTMHTKKTKGGLITLSIYVDDIFLTRSDDIGIYATKTYLK